MIKENEIICSAHAVKYHQIEYHDNYVVVTQNRTRRRIPNGYYFDDNNTHIFISCWYSSIFQHKRKIKRFVLNTVTKEWRDFQDVIIEKHKPEAIEPKESNTITRLKK